MPISWQSLRLRAVNITPPLLREFLSVFWGDWLARMSGGFSVPFGAVAVFFSETAKAQTFWWALAIAALIFCAYRVWLSEHLHVVMLTDKIRPKLRPSFSMEDAGCVRPNTVITAGMRLQDGSFQGGQIASTYFRLRVEPDAVTTLTGCRGRLTAIGREGKPIMEGDNLTLPFASLGVADALSKTIHEGVPEYLDLLAITVDNHVLLATPNFVVPSGIGHDTMFQAPGKYVLRVVISCNEGPSVVAEPILTWTGNLATSRIDLPAQGKVAS